MWKEGKAGEKGKNMIKGKVTKWGGGGGKEGMVVWKMKGRY